MMLPFWNNDNDDNVHFSYIYIIPYVGNFKEVGGGIYINTWKTNNWYNKYEVHF